MVGFGCMRLVTTPSLHGSASPLRVMSCLTMTVSPILNLGYAGWNSSCRTVERVLGVLPVDDAGFAGCLTKLTFPSFFAADRVLSAGVDFRAGPATPFGFNTSLSQVIPSSGTWFGFRRIFFVINVSSDKSTGSQVTLRPMVSPAALDSWSSFPSLSQR